jgi:hypothetical protein
LQGEEKTEIICCHQTYPKRMAKGSSPNTQKTIKTGTSGRKNNKQKYFQTQ